ncbi:MAG: antibiotic biosynthesis monooxygenase family protein [Candidatus Nitrosotenuis sp.]
MYVAIIDIPLKVEKENEFKAWIEETNKILSKNSGFIGRRLGKSTDGKYIIIAEFKDKDTHHKIHQSPEHHQISIQLMDYLKEGPSRKFYDIIPQ